MKNLEQFFNMRYTHNSEVCAKKKDICIERLLKEITKNVGKQYNILDLGCGTGVYTKKMLHENTTVTGSDFSEVALSKLPNNVTAVKSDVSKSMPFDSNSFDVIMLMDIMELVPDLILFLNEIKRIIKKDGLIIGCVPNSNFLLNHLKILFTGKSISQIFYGTHTRFYSKNYLYEIFNKDGFELDDLEGITGIKRKLNYVRRSPFCLLSRDFYFSTRVIKHV